MRLKGTMTRRLAARLVTAAVTLSSVAGAVATTPAPRPPELPALAGETLDGIYADNLEYIEAAAAMAEVDGNHERAEALRAMAHPDRKFLSFDARADGRVVEVIGDLERAEKVSVLVPLWIPQASEVSLELARRGVSLTRTHLTGEELVDDLGAAGARGPAVPPPETNGAPRRLVAAAESAIKARGVGFSFPSKSDVLRDIDLDIHKHELLAIVGQNGSGKSTLASCLTGLFAPTSGTVTVDGKPTGDYKFADLARRVAYIFQVPEKQFVRKSVYEEMAHGLKALKVPADEVEQRVDEVLKTVHLDERKDSSPFLLSHGQKRRLSVACMVISEPEVVILDEPTFGQDWRQAGRLMDYMRSLADAGAAVTFITHDMRLVAEYADRCVAMSNGKIIFNGGPLELFSSPDVLAQAKLKAPPVFDFSRELLGEPTLATADVITQLEARFGRPGAVVQGS